MKVGRWLLGGLVAVTGVVSVGGLAYSQAVEPVPATISGPAPNAPAPAPSTPVLSPAETPLSSAAEPLTSEPTTPSKNKPRSKAEHDWACDMADDGMPVCEGNVPSSVGEYRTPKQEIARQRRVRAEAEREFADEAEAALRSCMEQTGMTRSECIADAAAGNAS